MRDSVGSSVGPTASVSMLNPRRANRPAMRVSTPGLFSTRIERMCLRPVRTPADASSSSSERISLVAGSPMTQPTISRAAAPGAIIGYVFSSRVTLTSTTTGPGVASAVRRSSTSVVLSVSSTPVAP